MQNGHLSQSQLPRDAAWALRRIGMKPARFCLAVNVREQRMSLFELRSADFQSAVSRISNPQDVGNSTALPNGIRRYSRLEICAKFKAEYELRRRYIISTSAYGIGQVKNSNQTPLGLHRIAQKVGGGHLIGTVFRSRKPIGLTWQGEPNGSIVHRIFWLEGLEPGHNSGGNVDTFERYIYIHGFGDETTLGRPASHGCIHLAARDLIPLFDRLPVGTPVWIGEN